MPQRSPVSEWRVDGGHDRHERSPIASWVQAVLTRGRVNYLFLGIVMQTRQDGVTVSYTDPNACGDLKEQDWHGLGEGLSDHQVGL